MGFFVSCFCVGRGVGCRVGRAFALFGFFALFAATVFAFVAVFALAVTRTAATVLSFFPTATPFVLPACDFAPFLPLPATATGTAWFASDGLRGEIRAGEEGTRQLPGASNAWNGRRSRGAPLA